MSDLLVALALTSTGVLLLAHALAHALLSRRPPRGGHQPPVTVLKPLKGLDDGLLENLVSFAEQDYPRFQLVLGTADPDDPALDVARRVRSLFPHLDVQVVAGAPGFGRNPKVTNLASLARHARHERWLISDSNVRVRPTYLRDLVADLERPGVGMVTSFFAGVGARRPGARLENLHLCSWVPGGMALSQVFGGAACVVGKSMLFRRADLDRAGGLEGVRDVLAEDYVLGRRFAALGLGVVTSPHVVQTVNARWSVGRFLARHVRWGQLRRRLAPAAFLAEPLMNPTPWALACALAGAPRVALCCAAAKLVSDALLAWRLCGRPPGPAGLALDLPKDLLIAGAWVASGLKRTTVWRGHRLRIGPGTVLLDPHAADGAELALEPLAPVADARSRA